MDESQSPDSGEDQPRRRRRANSKNNKQGDTYECFCGKTYLSYPAIYTHVKNKHSDYFNRFFIGKKNDTQRLVPTYSQDNIRKIFKLAPEPNFGRESGNSHQNQNMQPHDNFYYQNQVHMNYSYYRPDYQPEIQQNILAQLPIQQVMSAYMNKHQNRSPKRKYQIQLFFFLTIDCLNKNWQLMQDPRTENRQVQRYTAEFSCQHLAKVAGIFPQYLDTMREHPNYAFYIKHSCLIKSKEYQQILKKLSQFGTGKNLANPQDQSNQIDNSKNDP